MKKSLFLGLLLMAGFSFSGCDKTPKASDPSAPSSGNPVTAPVDYLGAAARAKKSMEKNLDVAGVKQTLELYRAQEGKYPKTLNELVGPNYLSKLPSPPAGMKFDYNPNTGDVKLVPQ